MTRVAVVVEGDTEREFVKRILATHLYRKGVDAKPICLGGGVSVSKIANCIRPLCNSFQVVTSLVDHYRFQKKKDATVEQLQSQILKEINRIMPSGSNCKIHPYVQQYEFEGLLFSDIEAFEQVTNVSTQILKRLESVRNRFQSPEDINDDYPPSKRIQTFIPQYDKVVNGVGIAERIKLTKIRKECKRFDCWMTFLESLGDKTRSY